jgi:hypothetical protein
MEVEPQEIMIAERSEERISWKYKPSHNGK